MSENPKPEKKKKRRIYDFSPDEDIRYRGPLSYRGYKALGWLCIFFAQLTILLTIGSRMDPGMAAAYQTPIAVFGSLADMALPFLLIANFSLILNMTENYGAQLSRYALLTLGVAAAVLFFFSRYILGTAALIMGDRASALEMLQSMFWEFSGKGYIDFNIFVDPFLCTLLMFFLNYRPNHLFTGKKLLIFRAFAILPVAYEVVSILMKQMSHAGRIHLPFFVYPFLTVKPPLTFLVFIVLAMFIKNRERRFRKNGKTHEDYQIFLKSNRNSWQFSVFTAVTLAIAGLADIVLTLAYFVRIIMTQGMEELSNFTYHMTKASGLGLGQSVSLLLLAPIMLLFSYTRTHKNKTLDLMIPVIGIALIVIAFIEAGYQFLLMLPEMAQSISFGETADGLLELVPQLLME